MEVDSVQTGTLCPPDDFLLSNKKIEYSKLSQNVESVQPNLFPNLSDSGIFLKISSIRGGYSKTSKSTVLTWSTNIMLHAVILSKLLMIGAIGTPFVANHIQLSSVKPVNKINRITRLKSRMLALNFQHNKF